jgi:iron-sulfur cluster assembly protein
MAVKLTEAAARQIQKALATRGKGVGLRVGVKRVGCSGFAYTFDYADAVTPDDVTFESGEAKVVVAREHLQFLDGATLDFAKEGLRQFFRFENPNVANTCGCGESFSIA